MKKLLALVVIAILGLSSIQAKTIKLPASTVETAISMAREYVKERKLVSDRHYLSKIEYLGVYSEYKTPYWLVEYRLAAGSIKTAGGQVFVKIFNDGKISHTFGE